MPTGRTTPLSDAGTPCGIVLVVEDCSPAPSGTRIVTLDVLLVKLRALPDYPGLTFPITNSTASIVLSRGLIMEALARINARVSSMERRAADGMAGAESVYSGGSIAAKYLENPLVLVTIERNMRRTYSGRVVVGRVEMPEAKLS